jgi:hypothetical protein
MNSEESCWAFELEVELVDELELEPEVPLSAA